MNSVDTLSTANRNALNKHFVLVHFLKNMVPWVIGVQNNDVSIVLTDHCRYLPQDLAWPAAVAAGEIGEPGMFGPNWHLLDMAIVTSQIREPIL